MSQVYTFLEQSYLYFLTVSISLSLVFWGVVVHETVPGRGKGVSPAEFKIKLRNYDVEDQRFIKLVLMFVALAD